MENKSNSRTKKVQDTNLEDHQDDGPLFSGAHQYSESINSKNYLDVQLNNGLLHLSLPNKQCNKRAIDYFHSEQENNF